MLKYKISFQVRILLFMKKKNKKTMIIIKILLLSNNINIQFDPKYIDLLFKTNIKYRDLQIENEFLQLR